jgi:tRNA G46 methylase TrmB
LAVGCGDGGNLKSRAYHNPEVTFTGIEPSNGLIHTANEAVNLLGLGNIEFHLQFQPEEEYGYIMGDQRR